MADYLSASPPNGEQLIDYHVILGLRHKIVKLEIQGNHYFDDATIRERMSVIPATLVRYRYGRYSRNMLDRDLDAIRTLYRGNGFRDVMVTSRVVDDYNGARPTSPSSSTSRRDRSGSSPSSRSRAFPMIFGRARCCSCTPPPASPTAISTSPTIATTCSIITSIAAIQPAKFEFTSMPAAEADHVNLTFIVTPGTARVRARRSGGGAETHATRPGAGPHQPGPGRSAVAKPD